MVILKCSGHQNNIHGYFKMLSYNIACECHQNNIHGYFKMLSSDIACECHQNNIHGYFKMLSSNIACSLSVLRAVIVLIFIFGVLAPTGKKPGILIDTFLVGKSLEIVGKCEKPWNLPGKWFLVFTVPSSG